jgi:S-DNA-T family DNA segregation ATPase FtsK/SpoIIIE
MAAFAQSSRLASPALRSLIARRLATLLALLLAVGGVVLLVALGSFDPLDPSFNTATIRRARNLLGTPGALFADISLQGFGVAGGLPGLALLAWAWGAGVRGRVDGATLLLRAVALLVTLPVVAAVASGVAGVLALGSAWPTAAGPGGAIGGVLAGELRASALAMMGPFGVAGVAFLVLILAGLLLMLTLGLSGRDLGPAFALGRPAGRAIGAGWRSMTARREVVHHFDEPHERVTPAAPRVWQTYDADTPEPEARPAAIPPLTAQRNNVPPPLTASKPSAVAALVARAARKPRAEPEQPTLALEPGWQFPPLSLLTEAPTRAGIGAPSEEALIANDRLLESVLADYGVQGRIVNHRPGPVVTLYELEPAPGIRSARVIGLADDVARSLSVTAVRIATVSGRNVIGIEVPNSRRETVYLSELLSAPEWIEDKSKLSIALGKTIGGDPVIVDLARMPHLLVAGTTGSGKSVGINAMILSLLYRHSPEQCRLIMIDPKMLELSVYQGIPHLMAPVVTDPKKAVVALKWTVREMERRYRSMSLLSVRNIGGYNDRVAEARGKGEVVMRRVQTGFDSDTGKPTFEDLPLALEPLPFIVVVIDEMADLMMVAGKEIEVAVQRLAQMARAAGIHVVMATQRPSVDVITGTIKANFPTRISFQVISKFDSRTILGEQGSEQLLGMGDMLYMSGGGRIQRVHGPFVGDDEVEKIVAFLRTQGEPSYLEEVTEAEDADDEAPIQSGNGDDEGGLFDRAVDVISREGKASTSFLQRHLGIGYNKAAKLIERMEKEGMVSQANHVGKREVLLRRRGGDED